MEFVLELVSHLWSTLLLLQLLHTAAAAAELEVVAAVIRGSSPKHKRFSAHVISCAILHWYKVKNLTPRGVSTQAASVKDWALRCANATRKLVRPLLLVSRTYVTIYNRSLNSAASSLMIARLPSSRSSVGKRIHPT